MRDGSNVPGINTKMTFLSVHYSISTRSIYIVYTSKYVFRLSPDNANNRLKGACHSGLRCRRPIIAAPHRVVGVNYFWCYDICHLSNEYLHFHGVNVLPQYNSIATGFCETIAKIILPV